LTAAQKAGGDVLCKVVLTLQSDTTTYTYGVDTTNRLLDLKHSEDEWGQTAQISVDNRDGNLTGLTLEGCSAVISYGYHTTTDEYSAAAPLEVIACKTDAMQGELITTLSLAGVFNMMGEDEASKAYMPDSENRDTVKTILTAIANKTLPCFTHCKSYTITYDSEDSLIDTFKPADYFSVAFTESRLSAFRKALAFCKCKARLQNDLGVATIHIFNPTVSGTTYDYEYNDAMAAANHNFFNKSVRKRLVIPNKVIVSNHPDQGSYTGNATDADSYAALGNRYIVEHHYARPASNAQCTAIAEAMIQSYQIAAEKGHGFAPMNCGQEVMDYVKITDSRAGDTRVGNIGFLERHYSPGNFAFEFRFGSLFMPGLAGTLPPRGTLPTETEATTREIIATLNQDIGNIYDVVSELIANYNTLLSYLIAREDEAVFKKLTVTEVMKIPGWDV